MGAVTQIINTFNFEVIFIGLHDTDLVIFMPPHVARLCMLVKFGGVERYLLGKSGLARETSIEAW